MIQQPSLFTDTPSRPRKRGHVPRTSVLAALEVDRASRASRVLERLRGWGMGGRGWPTSAELAAWISGDSRPSTDAVLFARRGLSDLLADGLVAHAGQRTCSVSGRSCLTWRTVGR